MKAMIVKEYGGSFSQYDVLFLSGRVSQQHSACSLFLLYW